MRLDKFLKVSRIIKRRTVAKEVCVAGKVMLNGRVAKASTEVEAGDEIEIAFGSRNLKIRVLATPESIKAKDASTIYEEID